MDLPTSGFDVAKRFEALFLKWEDQVRVPRGRPHFGGGERRRDAFEASTHQSIKRYGIARAEDSKL